MIRADYRAWFTRAEAYVRDRRGDVLIKAAPGSTRELFASALPYAAAGYPGDLVVLAVREADSRLATALKRGGTGWFTSRSGHDTCFRALADVVTAAEPLPQESGLVHDQNAVVGAEVVEEVAPYVVANRFCVPAGAIGPGRA